MNKKSVRLGDILLEKHLIRYEDLEKAIKEQALTKEFLGDILVKRRFVKEEDVLKSLGEQFGIPFISLRYRYIDRDFLSKFSATLILDYKCFPVERDDYSITIAITNPLDAWVIKKAEEETLPFKLKLALATKEDILEAIKRYKEYIR